MATADPCSALSSIRNSCRVQTVSCNLKQTQEETINVLITGTLFFLMMNRGLLVNFLGTNLKGHI